MEYARDILVVDEEPTIVDLITETLKDEGYTVRSAVDEAGAQALFNERRPDLIVADLHLEGTEKTVLARHFACIGQVGVPVILMTTDSQTAAAISIDGIAGCLVKPFNLDELIDCVAEHVRRDRAVA